MQGLSNIILLELICFMHLFWFLNPFILVSDECGVLKHAWTILILFWINKSLNLADAFHFETKGSNQPLRVHSMVKYAAIAQGDAEIFMKFARAGYKEKIWDHAAGVLLVQEAGGVVTDAGGKALDFSRGIYLEGLDRGIVACSGLKLHEKIIGAVYASWDSSNL